MQVISITAPGGPEVLVAGPQPLPDLQPDQVLIRVAAAGVNGPDLAQRRGHYDPPPGASPLPGLEVAGEIVALGSTVTKLAIGDRVMALTNGGGYAEYAAVPAGQVLPAPANWSYAEAAALPETWFTVTQTLVMRAGLEPGMFVLIHGGAGGIGSAAIQITQILGARPIAIVSSDDKAAYCRRLGAVATINRTTDDIVQAVSTTTAGHGVDRVVDLIGGDMAAVNISACAPGAHIVQVSTLEGTSANVPLRQMMAKGLTLSGSTLRPQSAATKAAIAKRIRDDLLPALAKPGWVRPSLSNFPLARAAEAHRLMESRAHSGKIVLLTDFGAAQDPV
ncbi:MAG: NAD(P)H-quinone oxidoreductase [Devosia sp.]|nr:MAG: NAD(P)H-quinone oxidoreductase [Devosia sp.]